jgi:MFS family permease
VCSLAHSLAGSHYSAHVLGALKITLKKELDISNAQYGILQSAVSLVNTVLPILAGFFIDMFGTKAGSLVASSLILVGNTLVALSTHMKAFPVMVLGRGIYGIGAGSIVMVQETILAQWFHGQGYGTSIGFMLSFARLVVI